MYTASVHIWVGDLPMYTVYTIHAFTQGGSSLLLCTIVFCTRGYYGFYCVFSGLASGSYHPYGNTQWFADICALKLCTRDTPIFFVEFISVFSRNKSYLHGCDRRLVFSACAMDDSSSGSVYAFFHSGQKLVSWCPVVAIV